MYNPCTEHSVAVPADATRQLMKQYHVNCALYATSCAPPFPLALLPFLGMIVTCSITHRTLMHGIQIGDVSSLSNEQQN